MTTGTAEPVLVEQGWRLFRICIASPLVSLTFRSRSARRRRLQTKRAFPAKKSADACLVHSNVIVLAALAIGLAPISQLWKKIILGPDR